MFTTNYKHLQSIYTHTIKKASLVKKCKHTLTNIPNVFRYSKLGDSIEVQGWAKSVRKMKDTIFIDVADGTNSDWLQVTIPKSLLPENLTPGCSIKVQGLLNTAPKGHLELNADNIKVLGPCNLSEGYPFAPRKTYSNEYLRQYLHLRSRTNKFSAIFRVRSHTTQVIHQFFETHEFINIHTPVLTSNDCEGAGETFTVTAGNRDLIRDMIKSGQSEQEAYFNTNAFLTVSGQLHLEAAAHGLSKVYTLNPTFRAENSRSRLHLSEFYMLEAEQAFLEHITDLTGLIQTLVRDVTKVLLDKCGEDIRLAGMNEDNEKMVDASSWVDKEFPILEYTEAIEVLKRAFNGVVNESEGLTKEQEFFLVEHCGNVPCFVVNWPKDIKSFYMRECADNPANVSALDLLVPNVGELVGGSLRENDYDKLKSRIPSGLTNLDWYLDLRKFGAVPTGGFGLGFERYLQLLIGISNIKDTIPFPRWPHNCNL